MAKRMEIGQLYKFAKQKVQQRIGVEWKHLARAFEFQETDIAAIQQSSRNDLHEEIYQMFVKWEERCHSTRCVHELLNGLRKAAKDTGKQLLSDIAGELLTSLIYNQFVEKIQDRWHEIAEEVGFTPAEIHECTQVDPIDRQAQSSTFLERWCQKEGWNMLMQLPTALQAACFIERAEKFAQGVYGMSLANFVSWRDSLLCQVHYQPPPALEKGSLVKVMHSGLLLYGVVKEVKTDGHTTVAAVEMEEDYDCLGERLKDGIADFPVQDIQLDTHFFQRHESIGSFEVPSQPLMDLHLDDDPPRWSLPPPLSPASSITSPGTPQGSLGSVRIPHREQPQDTDFTLDSDCPNNASGQEAGAVQLSPVRPVEGKFTKVLRIPGDRAGLLISAGGKIRKRIEGKTNAKLTIDRPPGADVSGDAKVTISGSKEQCREAEKQVLSVIRSKNMEYTGIIPALVDRMFASCCDELEQESKAKALVKWGHDK